LDFVIAANSPEFTLEASRSVMKDLAIAIVLVALAMLLFLHSARDALIVTVAIPVSLVSTFTFMYLLGSMFPTLVIVPLVYYMMDKAMTRGLGKR
jgi:HAE1 family hydrophobic/amphiphilic exporter-1